MSLFTKPVTGDTFAANVRLPGVMIGPNQLPNAGSCQALIEEIVEAVRAGHDGRIGSLLRRFAVQADITALFLLRAALHADCPAVGPAGREFPARH